MSIHTHDMQTAIDRFLQTFKAGDTQAKAIGRSQQATAYNRHSIAGNVASLEGETLESFDRTLPALLGDSRQANRHLQHHRLFTLLDKLPDNGHRPTYQPRPLLTFPVPAYQPTESEIEAAGWLDTPGNVPVRPFNVKANRAARKTREMALAAARKGIAWAA